MSEAMTTLQKVPESQSDICDPAATQIEEELLLPDPAEKQEPEYTVDDVRQKLEAELEIYRDGDSRYVVQKLIELSAKDTKLLAGIMRPDKSYDKAFQYFFLQSRKVGYKLPYGNLVFLDNDSAVKLAVEYFKLTKPPQARKKKKRGSKTVSAAEVKEPQPMEKVATSEVPEENKNMESTKKKVRDIDGQISLFDL